MNPLERKRKWIKDGIKNRHITQEEGDRLLSDDPEETEMETVNIYPSDQSGEIEVQDIYNDSWSGLTACFTANTPILFNNGIKKIATVKVGDQVWSYSEKDNSISLQLVTQTFVRKTDRLMVLSLEEQVVETTPEHPFYVPDRGWVQAKDLEIGTSLFSRACREMMIENIQIKDTLVEVYNFEVANNHTYFVSDLELLVHNTCTGQGDGTGETSTFDQAAADASESLEVTEAAETTTSVAAEEAAVGTETAAAVSAAATEEAVITDVIFGSLILLGF